MTFTVENPVDSYNVRLQLAVGCDCVLITTMIRRYCDIM